MCRKHINEKKRIFVHQVVQYGWVISKRITDWAESMKVIEPPWLSGETLAKLLPFSNLQRCSWKLRTSQRDLDERYYGYIMRRSPHVLVPHRWRWPHPSGLHPLSASETQQGFVPLDFRLEQQIGLFHENDDKQLRTIFAYAHDSFSDFYRFSHDRGAFTYFYWCVSMAHGTGPHRKCVPALSFDAVDHSNACTSSVRPINLAHRKCDSCTRIVWSRCDSDCERTRALWCHPTDLPSRWASAVPPPVPPV